MTELLFPLIACLAIFCIEPQPNALPDHPLYSHYTYNFSNHEKDIIVYHAQKAKQNINEYVWPTNTSSPRLNNFFRILNSKSYNQQYNKAILFLLNLVPDLLDSSQEAC